MRHWAASMLCAALLPLAAGAEPANVSAGIRQVKDGDLEGGVQTLEGVIREMAGDPARARDLVRAYLYIGIAKVGLNEPSAARARFLDALALDANLRLTSLEFSPRVVAAFDAARREAPASSKPGGSVLPIVALGAGAAGAGAIVLASSGSGDGGAAAVRFTDARFASPTLVCSNGSQQVLIPVSVLINATNPRADAVTISQMDSVLTIVSSSFTDEIGFASRRPTSVLPGGIAPRSTVTLRVDTTLVCTNDFGNAERSNTWTAEVTISANVATLTLKTADLLRVEIP